MTYQYILVEVEDGVGIVTLNRPDKLNAMNRQLSGELHDAVKRMEGDETIGCIVVTGAGDHAFSVGATFTSSARMIAATLRRTWMRSALRAAAPMKLPPAQSRQSG